MGLGEASSWTTMVDPISLGTFWYKSSELENSFLVRIAACNEIRVSAFLRCGNEGPSRSFTTKVWTVDRNQNKHHNFIFGARYPQSAISFSTTTMEFPYPNDGKIFISSSDSQDVNCHGCELFLVAYR